MTNDGRFIYAWNEADRLKEVRQLSDTSLVMSCKYDGFGRRVERVTYSSGAGTTNRYVYNGWLVLAVLDQTNGAIGHYVHGPDLSGDVGGAGGIGGILSVSNSTLVGYFAYDGNGNIVNVTDTNRATVSSISYGPFGSILAQSGSYSPRYKFSSKEWDAAANLFYYGFRYYAPRLGRWTTRDPLGEWRGCNTMTFVRNNPIGAVDPSGLLDVPLPPQFTCPSGKSEVSCPRCAALKNDADPLLSG